MRGGGIAEGDGDCEHFREWALGEVVKVRGG